MQFLQLFLSGHAANVAYRRLAKMHFARHFGKAFAHILGMGQDMLDHLLAQGVDEIARDHHHGFLHFIVFRNGFSLAANIGRGRQSGNFPGVTKGARNMAVFTLAFKARSGFEPAFKPMFPRAGKIINNHNGISLQLNLT